MRSKVNALAVSLLFAVVFWALEAQGEVVAPAMGAPAGPAVLDLACTPDVGKVDVADTYHITFRSSDTIPVAGGFRITFPEGFGLGGAGVSYSDAPGVASLEPDFLRWRDKSPSGSRTQISGTEPTGMPFCRRASRSRFSGLNTDGQA